MVISSLVFYVYFFVCRVLTNGLTQERFLGTQLHALCFGTQLHALCLGTPLHALCFGTPLHALSFGTQLHALCFGTPLHALCFGTQLHALCLPSAVHRRCRGRERRRTKWQQLHRNPQFSLRARAALTRRGLRRH